MVKEPSDSDAGEEFAALTKLVEASLNRNRQKEKLGPITQKEAIALLEYIDSLESPTEKRNVTEVNSAIGRRQNELWLGLTKLIRIAAASLPDEAEGE